MTGQAAPHRAGRPVYPGRDPSLLIAGQAVHAAGCGFTAVLLGALLAPRGDSHLCAGVVLTALIAGTGQREQGWQSPRRLRNTASAHVQPIDRGGTATIANKRPRPPPT